MTNCLNCGLETNNPKFCSRSCAATYTNKIKPKRKRTKTCTKCSLITFTYRHTLCKAHWEAYKEREYKDKTIGECRNMNSVKGKHPSWAHVHVRNFARSWLKHLTKEPCRHCGYDKHVELAHIKDVASFPDDTPLIVVNSEDNVIPLCPNCHWEFDNLPRKE